MAEDSSEPVEEELEGEEIEEEEARARRKRKLLTIAAIVVAVVVVSATVGVFLLAAVNNPPIASFTALTKDERVVVEAKNSTDPGGSIASFSWNWGDGTSPSNTTAPYASHAYAQEGTYTITLTVMDTTGLSDPESRDVTITVLPTPHFIARHDRKSVSFDATGSFHGLGVGITSYQWDFGDGTTGSGQQVVHDYTTPDRYVAKLTVTDARSRTASATRYVSPAETTVDILADRFFVAGCPYEDYWRARKNVYGDEVLRDEVPCTDYYPWVLYSGSVALQRVNPSYLYTLYRWDARVRNHPSYNVSEPVMLPVFDPSVAPDPDSYVLVDYTFDYLDSVLANQLRVTPFAVNRKYYSDGFGNVVRGTYTMDLTMAQRLFGMRGAIGKLPLALDASGAGNQWTGSAWGALPALPAPPLGPETTGWADLVVASDNTAFAIATDSTVYKLESGGSAWSLFISPPTAAWAKPTTDVVAIAVDHDQAYYAVTRGSSTGPINPSIYRYVGSGPGSWSLVGNLSARHTTLTGGVVDLAHVSGTGTNAVLYLLPVNLKFPRDPSPYSPFTTPSAQGWTTPLNGTTSDNGYTNATSDGATLVFGSYRIVPIGGETLINGVEIGIEGKAVGDDDVRVEFSTDGGSTWTTAGAFDPGSTDSTTIFDVTSLRSWTYALLNNTNFRTRIAYVQVGSSASTVAIDWVTARVAAGNASVLRTTSGGAAWTTLGAKTPVLAGTEYRALAVESPSQFHVLLSNGSLLRTQDAVSWSWISKASASPSGADWQELSWTGRNGLWAIAKPASGPEAWKYDVSTGTWTNVTAALGLADPVAVGAADPQQWWHAQTAFARATGTLESRFGQWLESQGNGKYDIYNGFEWFYETDFTDVSGVVAEDGTTTVSLFAAGWGWDSLQARWFYWGNASYQRAVCVEGYDTETVKPPLPCESTLDYGTIQPQGWSPMETCWCEQVTVVGKITDSLDLDFTGIQGYHFEAWANVGADTLPRSGDDMPAWVFQPYLMDYQPAGPSNSVASVGYPNSELNWYIGLKTYHMTPGSYGYGTQLEYLVSPGRWPLKAGSTLTLVLPRFEVPWYDPVLSTWNPTTKIGDYVTFMDRMILRLIKPAGDYFLWDSRANVLSIAGPDTWGVPDTQLPLDYGWPYIEFGPEARG